MKIENLIVIWSFYGYLIIDICFVYNFFGQHENIDAINLGHCYWYENSRFVFNLGGSETRIHTNTHEFTRIQTNTDESCSETRIQKKVQTKFCETRIQKKFKSNLILFWNTNTNVSCSETRIQKKFKSNFLKHEYKKNSIQI